MSTDTDPLAEIADAVRELTDAQRHVELYVKLDSRNRPLPAKPHITKHPSLLDQLRDAATAGRGGGDEILTGGYESRPTARLEAIGQLIRIEQAVDDWLVRKFDATPRVTIEDQLRQIVGLAPTVYVGLQRDLARETNRWRIWARVVTGWDSAPWQPKVPCPMCETRGELRIRLLEKSAACLHCGAAWDASTFGLLADQIASADAAAVTAAQARAELAADLAHFFPRLGPCLCAVTEPHDARHRLIDALYVEVATGVDQTTVASTYGVPVRAVSVAIAALESFPHLEPYPPPKRQSA